jgi:hypothetical protein
MMFHSIHPYLKAVPFLTAVSMQGEGNSCDQTLQPFELIQKNNYIGAGQLRLQ